MGRDRVLRLAAVVICVLALVAVGARYALLRDDRQHTEQSVATLRKHTRQALVLLHAAETKHTAADQHNAELTTQRDAIRTLAAALHTDLSRTRAETTTSAVGAFVSGSQANQLTQCLAGISQALNQLAVGDANSILSLQAVEEPCRRAGIQ
jgi:hypothetical protein